MSQIGVVVDSAASLPRELAEQLGIAVVPIQIQIGDRSYRENVDLSREDVYRRLAAGEKLMTSQPSPGSFAEVYQRLTGEAKSIVSLHVGANWSGTYNCARLVSESLPEADIAVVDTQAYGMGLGFLAITAARLALLGKGKEKILACIADLRERLTMFAVVPTLTFLLRTGRVSLPAGIVGSLLAIKPILAVRSGGLHVAEKVRTMPQALERLIALTEAAVGQERRLVAVEHANAPAAAGRLASEAKRRLNCEEVMITDMTACMVVGGGPGFLSVASCPLPGE